MSGNFATIIQVCEGDLCIKHLRIKPSILEPNKYIQSNTKTKMPRILLKRSTIQPRSSIFKSIIVSSECQLALSNRKIMSSCEGDPSKSFQAIVSPYYHSRTTLSMQTTMPVCEGDPKPSTPSQLSIINVKTRTPRITQLCAASLQLITKSFELQARPNHHANIVTLHPATRPIHWCQLSGCPHPATSNESNQPVQ